MKRTRTLTLTGLMAVGGVSLSACGDRGASEGARAEVPASTEAFVYQSLQACRDGNKAPDTVCDTAVRNAIADDEASSRWPDRVSCEAVYGYGQCLARPAPDGREAVWGPLLMGFVVGRTTTGGWGGRGIFSDWRNGGYFAAGGGRLWSNYPTGRLRISRRSFDPPDYRRGPEQVMSCAISRGGFGRRMNRNGGCYGHWGG